MMPSKSLFGLLCFLLTAYVPAMAQNKPSGTSQVSGPLQTPVSAAGPYGTGTPINYIRTWQPQVPYAAETDVISAFRTSNEVTKATQYFDGLGRPLQTVSWQASPGKTDLIQPVIYDAFGREAQKYLPFTTSSNTAGTFENDPFNKQKTFYNTTYPTEQPAFANEQFFYGQTVFEPSPLNRVSASFAPGNSWVGSNKGTSVEYLFNTAAENIKIWNIASAQLNYDGTENNINIPTSAANYADGQLYKTVTKDEHGNAVVEYKDKEGRVILKKVQIGATVPANYNGTSAEWLCTYYVYDDFGQLRFVIPPKAVATLATLGLNSNVVKELCFRYEYDHRLRMIAKKVPGAGWVYMVYDKRDRLVATQDANMYAKSPRQWMYTLYDVLNRPVETGIMTYGGSWSALQGYVNGLNYDAGTSYASTGSYVSATPDNLLLSERENARQLYQANNSIVFQPGFVSEDGAVFTAEIVTTAGSTFSNAVTVNANPLGAASNVYPLTRTYYDAYTPYTTKTYTPAHNSKLDNAPGLAPEALPSAASGSVRGMVTVTKVRVLENPNDLSLGKWMETVTFYNDKGRPIQVQNDNYKGGPDVTISKYDFTGKVIGTYQVHNNASGNIANLRVKTEMQYDHAGRLLKITKQVNDDANTLRTIVQNSYDALGQLKNKKVGQKSLVDTSPLEDDTYSYNIRGWLKGVNNYNGSTYASQTNSANKKWFSLDLAYDWGYNTNQYNGNIAGMRWKSAGDNKERSYGYAYDAANRLMKGDYTQNNGSWGTDAVFNFDVKMGDGVNPSSAYDENGNIKQMQQWGLTGTASQQIDNLVYTYALGGVSNKLLRVEDNGVQPTTNMGDFNNKNANSDDYGYDVNGNLIADKNKRMNGATGIDLAGAGAIVYNHLNLPYKITVNNDDGTLKGTITYIYDATGNKLEKITDEAATAANSNTAKKSYTTYLGGYVYENNVLKFFGHEEGRIRKKADAAFAYDYFLKDHLGNVRMVLTDEKKQDIYPAATLEGNISSTGTPNAVNVEKDYYAINSANIADKSEATGITDYINKNGGINELDPPVNNNPSSNPTANSQKLYKLEATASGGVQGLGIALKVMAGDTISIYGKSYYFQNFTGTNYTVPTLDILSGLLSAPTGAAAGKGATATGLNGVSAIANPIGAFLTNPNRNNGTANAPKAYVNWILFDENFKYVDGNFDRVGSANSVKSHSLINVPLSSNGYLYVYVSNESPVKVFFDNLQVIHTRGPLLEETHYYPFGLTMAGISSKAAGGLANKKKFNGIEHTTDFDLNTYDAFFRNADPQIGRWWQIDPKPNMAESPYSMMGNNPISNVDPLGDTAVVRWRTGFLGLGKRHEARYVGDKWIDSKTRGNVDISQAKNGAQRLMNDYGGLNNNAAFDKVTDKINSHSANVVLTDSRKNETDPNSAFRDGAKELKVNLSAGATLRAELNEGNVSVRLNSQQVMGHELGHVYDILSGKPKSHFTTTERGTPIGTYITFSNSEINAMYWENILRIQAGLPLRTNYAYSRGGFGGTMLLNNSAIIKRDKTYQPVSIGDLDGNTFPVQ